MRKIKSTRLTYLFSFLYLCASISFFRADASAQTNEEEIIRVETQLVGFEVTVSDRAGKPVRGLQSKDFKVFEDGVERSIDFFEPVKRAVESRPLSIVFALDVSGSMTADEMARLREAMRNFVRRISADYTSYFAVMTFGMDVKVVQSFTNRLENSKKLSIN